MCGSTKTIYGANIGSGRRDTPPAGATKRDIGLNFSPDPITQLFDASVLRIGQSLAILVLWITQRHYPPARDWAIGAGLCAVGLPVLMLSSENMAPLPWIIGNTLVIAGWLVFDVGVVRAANRTPPWTAAIAVFVVGLVVIGSATGANANVATSVMTFQLVTGAFDLYAAWACFTVVKEQRSITHPLIGIALSLLAISGIVRGALLLDADASTVFVASLGNLQYALIAIPVFVLIPLLLTILTAERLRQELENQARRDALTHAYNRRGFAELAEREWARARRRDEPLSLLILDIDHFKEINDRYGHAIGDLVLTEASGRIQEVLRTEDLWCRFGGEEFIAMLPGTTLDDAILVAERLRESISDVPFITAKGEIHISVSIGVASRAAHHANWEAVSQLADDAVYRAKLEGRNRVARSPIVV